MRQEKRRSADLESESKRQNVVDQSDLCDFIQHNWSPALSGNLRYLIPDLPKSAATNVRGDWTHDPVRFFLSISLLSLWDTLTNSVNNTITKKLSTEEIAENQLKHCNLIDSQELLRWYSVVILLENMLSNA